MASKSKAKKKEKGVVKKKRRDQQYIVRDMMIALSLCHNVTPVYPDEKNPDYKEYQASSPDEVALVKFGEKMGMHLNYRDEETIKIINANSDAEIYEILADFPFTSESKRMGIILRHV
jgi:phospholipid-translocating ATPase